MPRASTPEALAAIRAQYHLDEPFLTQYLLWLGGVVQGDLGQSIRSDEPVTSLMANRVLLTMQLAVFAFVMTVARRGSARRRRRLAFGGSPATAASTTGAIVGVGAPSYAVGLLLLYVFGVRLGDLPGLRQR